MQYSNKRQAVYSSSNGNLNRFSYKMLYVTTNKEVNREALRAFESYIISALYQDTILDLHYDIEILSDGLDPTLKLIITI